MPLLDELITRLGELEGDWQAVQLRIDFCQVPFVGKPARPWQLVDLQRNRAAVTDSVELSVLNLSVSNLSVRNLSLYNLYRNSHAAATKAKQLSLAAFEHHCFAWLAVFMQL